MQSGGDNSTDYTNTIIFHLPQIAITTGKVCDSMEKHSVHLQAEAYLCSYDNDSLSMHSKFSSSVHSWDIAWTIPWNSAWLMTNLPCSAELINSEY